MGRFGFSTDKTQKKALKKAPEKQENAKKSAPVPQKEEKNTPDGNKAAVPFYKNLPRSVKRKISTSKKKGSR